MRTKYEYETIIQGHFAGYWEDVSTYAKPQTKAERDVIQNDLREYRASGVGVYRLINRRTLRAS